MHGSNRQVLLCCYTELGYCEFVTLQFTLVHPFPLTIRLTFYTKLISLSYSKKSYN
jgi:hypothetical protein